MRDESPPPGEKRPDLNWARTHELISGIAALAREDGWEASDVWLAKKEYSATGQIVRFENVTVDSYWVYLELEERRVHDHEACVAQMQKAHTRELLEWLYFARRFGGWYSPTDHSSSYGVSYEDLKNELSTREHIPNKVEGRNNRRKAALQHRKNKLRDEPCRR